MIKQWLYAHGELLVAIAECSFYMMLLGTRRMVIVRYVECHCRVGTSQILFIPIRTML